MGGRRNEKKEKKREEEGIQGERKKKKKDKKKNLLLALKKIWNASRICVSSLRRGRANLLSILPILVYVLPKRAQIKS